jgi:hypothetical protein
MEITFASLGFGAAVWVLLDLSALRSLDAAARF